MEISRLSVDVQIFCFFSAFEFFSIKKTLNRFQVRLQMGNRGKSNYGCQLLYCTECIEVHEFRLFVLFCLNLLPNFYFNLKFYRTVINVCTVIGMKSSMFICLIKFLSSFEKFMKNVMKKVLECSGCFESFKNLVSFMFRF